MSLETDIETAASKAKRLKSRNEEREAHSLKDMIEADKYLDGKTAVAGTKRRGLIITKMRPPGSI